MAVRKACPHARGPIGRGDAIGIGKEQPFAGGMPRTQIARCRRRDGFGRFDESDAGDRPQSIWLVLAHHNNLVDVGLGGLGLQGQNHLIDDWRVEAGNDNREIHGGVNGSAPAQSV